MNGFLWGAALGGGLAYLLSTKRGRDLLKDLTQDGLDMLDDLTAEPEESSEELSPLADEPIAEPMVVEQQPAAVFPSESKVSPEKPKKRFFRARKK